MKLAYTKVSADSLPIQSTRLAHSTPCYIPLETPSVNMRYAFLENDGWGGYCRDQEVDESKYDDKKLKFFLAEDLALSDVITINPFLFFILII